jgi:hypothetical protein
MRSDRRGLPRTPRDFQNAARQPDNQGSHVEHQSCAGLPRAPIVACISPRDSGRSQMMRHGESADQASAGKLHELAMYLALLPIVRKVSSHC